MRRHLNSAGCTAGQRVAERWSLSSASALSFEVVPRREMEFMSWILRRRHYVPVSYGMWARLPINNTYLAYFRAYGEDVHWYRIRLLSFFCLCATLGNYFVCHVFTELRPYYADEPWAPHYISPVHMRPSKSQIS